MALPDREKVIAALEKACRDSVELPPFAGRIEITKEAVEEGILPLLREQEPVEPIKKPGIVEPYKCGACGAILGWESEKQRFCPKCGRGINGMIDREKVIRGLEACRNEGCTARSCPYATEECCVELLCHDALILLRELAREEDDGK